MGTWDLKRPNAERSGALQPLQGLTGQAAFIAERADEDLGQRLLQAASGKREVET